VSLIPERSVVACIAINKIVEDIVCRPLVEALVNQQCGYGVSELVDPIGAIFPEIAGYRPEQHGACDVVSIRAPLGPMPVP